MFLKCITEWDIHPSEVYYELGEGEMKKTSFSVLRNFSGGKNCICIRRSLSLSILLESRAGNLER